MSSVESEIEYIVDGKLESAEVLTKSDIGYYELINDDEANEKIKSKLGELLTLPDDPDDYTENQQMLVEVVIQVLSKMVLSPHPKKEEEAPPIFFQAQARYAYGGSSAYEPRSFGEIQGDFNAGGYPEWTVHNDMGIVGDARLITLTVPKDMEQVIKNNGGYTIQIRDTKLNIMSA